MLSGVRPGGDRRLAGPAHAARGRVALRRVPGRPGPGGRAGDRAGPPRGGLRRTLSPPIHSLEYLAPGAARRALAAARNAAGGGSLTVVATAPAPAGGETTVVTLDARAAPRAAGSRRSTWPRRARCARSCWSARRAPRRSPRRAPTSPPGRAPVTRRPPLLAQPVSRADDAAVVGRPQARRRCARCRVVARHATPAPSSGAGLVRTWSTVWSKIGARGRTGCS